MKTIIKTMFAVSASLIALNAAAKSEGRAANTGPTLSFGGSVTGYGAAVDQKSRIKGSGPDTTFVSKGNLVMSVGGNASNGMSYGGVAVVNFDRAKTGNDRISEAYVFGNHDSLGSFKLGDTEGVVSNMMFTGDDVLGGLGGTSGDLDKLINMTRGVWFRPSIASTNDKATKLVWVSPEYAGFQIGLDFTPSTKLHGRSDRGVKLNSSGNHKTASNSPYSTNLVGGAISYNKALQNCNVGVYLAGHTGSSKHDSTTAGAYTELKFKKTKAWQVGTLLDYKDWQFAASYFNNNNSLVRENAQRAALGGVTLTGDAPTGHSNTKGVNAAVGYDFARNANIGVGYTHSYRDVTNGKAKADVATVTLDYVVAPGWVAFAEVDYFTLKAPRSYITAADTVIDDTGIDIYGDRPSDNGNNRGTVLVLGTKLRF